MVAGLFVAIEPGVCLGPRENPNFGTSLCKGGAAHGLKLQTCHGLCFNSIRVLVSKKYCLTLLDLEEQRAEASFAEVKAMGARQERTSQRGRQSLRLDRVSNGLIDRGGSATRETTRAMDNCHGKRVGRIRGGYFCHEH
jgi:hypothetical protein